MGARALVLRVVVVLCAVLTCLFGLSSSAFAGFTHPFVASFGSFANVQGVAVNNATGDVYVYDGGAGKVLRFDASGNPLNFSSTGTNAIEGVGGAGSDEGEIAVDSSAGPAKGDIYVAHAGGSIEIYSEAGEEIGELTEEAPNPWGEACGVAVDANGDVYVGLYSAHIDKFVPTGNPVKNSDFASSMGGLNGVCNVGADSLGDAYAITWSSGPVTRYEAAQFGSLAASGSVVDTTGSSMASDPANDEVYVDEGGQVAQFGPEGEPFQEPKATFAASGTGAISGSVGIAVSAFNGDVYVSDGKGKVSVFGPGVILPDVSTGAASNVQAGSATVSGSVNPSGAELTECKVEYGTNSSYGQSQACAETPEEIGSGSNPVEVHADLSGLAAGSLYHYRLVAADANGTVDGEDATFIMPAAPSVTKESFSSVAEHEALLTAQINPNDASTTYRVEYGTSESYGQSSPESEPIGSDTTAHAVTVHLSGLTPGATYHFRFVATNSIGTTDGADTTLTTYAPPAKNGGCPNEARREEQNATYLPDCRAYEMVSPTDKDGSDVVGANNTAHLSDSGDRASFEAFAGFGEAHGSGDFGFSQYVTTRNPNTGWGVPFGVTPQPAKGDSQIIYGATDIVTYSNSLDKAFMRAYQLVGSTNPDIPHNANFYVEDTETGSLEAATTPTGVEASSFPPLAFQFGYRGASADLSVVAFEGSANLMPELPFTSKLYELNHGKLEVAGVLPDGSFPAGGSGGATTAIALRSERMTHEVSRDGSEVLFRSPVDGSKPAQLYMRRNATKSTAWVSQSEASTPNPEPEGVEYIDTAADGKVLFGSRTPLTDSDPGGEGRGLYLYTDSPNPETEQNLTFIARIVGSYSDSDATDRAGASYTGMSDDAKRIYFFSQATAALPQEGTYLWDEGTLHFVTSAGPLSDEVSVSGFQHAVARVSDDGKELAFLTNEQLTEAPVGRETYGGPLATMYLYEEASGSLRCVSCLPSGAPTSSSATIWPETNSLTVINFLEMNGRFLSKDGRYVFFSTADALVPADVNGVEDAYEYDAHTGKVSLLSSGTDGNASFFSDASPDGSNVLIVGRTSYLRQDTDNLIDVYDVRANGGFPQPPPSTGGCVGDECQGVPSAAPTFSTASGFTGLGNIVHSSGKAKPKAKSLTRAQKLRRALKACRRKRGKARHRCVARARKRYGAHKASKSTSRAARR